MNPAKTYKLTLFGSRKDSTVATTVYTVYTSDNFTTAITSASLDVRDPANPSAHNSNRVAYLSNLTPQQGNSLFLGVIGVSNQPGYINAMKLEEEAAPVTISHIGPSPSYTTISFTGIPGVVYGLESTTNPIQPTDWRSVQLGSALVTGTGAAPTMTTMGDTNSAVLVRGYRVILAP